MRSNGIYESDGVSSPYDSDPQDGTYFRELEPPRDERDDVSPEGTERDIRHEIRKHRAVLYIRAHKELLMNAAYLRAYNRILDEYAKEYACRVLKKPIFTVSDRERELESSTLDIEIACLAKSKLERYKDNAAYIVDWISSGKSLIVYN